jgi:osmotically-inducible protein OsmY
MGDDETKVPLMTTEGQHQGFNVDTVTRVVTLHGKVPTEGAKAESVARGIDGAKQVRTRCRWFERPALSWKVGRRDQEERRGSVQGEPPRQHSGINVASVNKGVVLLSGKTKSLAHLESAEVANAVEACGASPRSQFVPAS